MECKGSMALPRGNSKTGSLELARPQAPLPADSPQGTQGGYTVQVEVFGQRRQTVASDIMSDSQGS